MHEEPLGRDTPYDDIMTAIMTSERGITDVCTGHFKSGSPITYADFFGMGVARRSLAMSSGFRSMIEQRNALCALPMVRMQLDTVLRLYAAYFVTDHQKFCRDVLGGKQIDHMKSDDGKLMKDSYLRDRVAQRNPWVVNVYKLTSGWVHLSSRHIFEAMRMGDDHSFEMIIGPNDAKREPEDYHEPMRCVHHLNLMIKTALEDWFGRMCVPGGPVVSAQEFWAPK